MFFGVLPGKHLGFDTTYAAPHNPTAPLCPEERAAGKGKATKQQGKINVVDRPWLGIFIEIAEIALEVISWDDLCIWFALSMTPEAKNINYRHQNL